MNKDEEAHAIDGTFIAYVSLFMNVDISLNPSLIALNMVYHLPVVGVSVSDRLVTSTLTRSPYLLISLLSEN